MTQSNEPFSPEKQTQILRGAAVIFARDGYEGASMSQIACEAGVSKGTLYNYFENKADLFAAYVRGECATKLAYVFDNVGPEGDPAAALRNIGLRFCRMVLSNAGLTIYRVVVAEAGKFPDLARRFYEAGPSVAIRHLADWLSRQTEAGRLAVPDPVFAAEQFLSLCLSRWGERRKLQLLDNPSPAEVEYVVDAAVAMFLRTYGA